MFVYVFVCVVCLVVFARLLLWLVCLLVLLVLFGCLRLCVVCRLVVFADWMSVGFVYV